MTVAIALAAMATLALLWGLWHQKPAPAPVGFDPAVGQDASSKKVVKDLDASFEDKWAASGLKPAPRATQLAIVRRLSLALTGTVPSLEEVRAIEKQDPSTVVSWWLTRIFQDRRYSTYLAERLARAYVGVEDGPFLVYRRHRMVDWLADRIQKNRPYDETARRLIDSHGIWTTQPEVNFVTVTIDQNNKENGPDEAKLAARVSRAFLGVRLDCVQCHRDFLNNRWKQEDFHGLAAFFAPAEMSLTGVHDKDDTKYEVRYHGRKDKELVHPGVPFNAELLSTNGPLRQRLATWVTHPRNQAFARTTVNRVWALMFNRPLVEPIDDIPLHGPYPPGLEILADDLVANHYDLQRLVRLIAASRPFQLDSAGNRSGDDGVVDETHEKSFAAFPLTRLRPEQVAGGLIQACSLHTIDADAHVLPRIIRFFQQNDFVKRYGDIGEDEFNQRSVTIPQRLVLLNGDLLHERSKENIVLNASTRIAALAPSDEAAVETAYLCALTRRPSKPETEHFSRELEGLKGKERHEAMEDIFWALINTTEFSWNH